jgi:hypothetical protein
VVADADAGIMALHMVLVSLIPARGDTTAAAKPGTWPAWLLVVAADLAATALHTRQRRASSFPRRLFRRGLHCQGGGDDPFSKVDKWPDLNIAS